MEVAVGETSARVLAEPKPIVTEVCKNKEVTILKEKLLETNKKIMPYALTLVGSYADAEDLCQTTMMKLIENQDKFLQSNTPIPIALFLICWLVKLVEDSLIKKADWQINVGMAEAWVLFIWAIISMFGDYRAWF